MNNLSRRLAILVVALGLAVAACGGSTTETTAGQTTVTTSAATTTAATTPATTGGTTATTTATTMAAVDLDPYLVTPGTLTVATTGNFPPFTQINESTGDVEGYSIDVAAEVAKRMGLELATPTVDFVAELQGLQDGLYDIGDSGIWPTEERQQTFAFSRPMTSAGFIALVRAEDADGPGLSDVKGLKIGAIQGSTHEKWTIDNEADLGYAEYVPFAGAAEAITGLKQGRVDVLTSDSLIAAYNANNDPDLATAGPTIEAHPLSMTFRQDSQPLIDAFNPALDAMITDGTLAEIQMKWFGTCVPVPADINAAPPYDTLPEGC